MPSTRPQFCSKNGLKNYFLDLVPPLTKGAFVLNHLAPFLHVHLLPFKPTPLCQLLSLLPAMPDGVLDATVRAEEAGSEEDLYEDLHSSGHHYSHPGGGGEQLAINEVGSRLCG